MISVCIKKLVEYGIKRGLIEKADAIYTRNMLLLALDMDEYKEPGEVGEITTSSDLEEVLNTINDYAVENSLIPEDNIIYRDLFDTKIMNILVPRPSQVIGTFFEKYYRNPKEATDYYYKLSKDSDYIRTYRVDKDKKWKTKTEYGDLDITINLSKPEKDVRAIALTKTMKSISYPKCQLCIDNEGYAGRLNHPARENHRIIPITLRGEKWAFQYSPYVYYNEHCIVYTAEHKYMEVNRTTFEKLLDFLEQFPHYYIGANGDIPIVGASILDHEHFQGGNYTFPLNSAPIEQKIEFQGFESLKTGIVHWPVSVIRITGKERKRMVDLAEKILNTWRDYTDEEAFIYSSTNGEPHNTVTTIARMRNGLYEFDIALRNNITTKEHPLGVFHPHAKYQHIKKENIGLIEVQGLAVLPRRLKAELDTVADALLNGTKLSGEAEKHSEWLEEIREKYDDINTENVEGIIQTEVGLVFEKVLECSGVFKQTKAGRDAFARFIARVNAK